MDIFKTNNFVFPYNQYHFPGQDKNELILYVTREAKIMLYIRMVMVTLTSLTLVLIGYIITGLVQPVLNIELSGFKVWSFVLGIVFALVGNWWSYTLWQKSIFILTTRRLTKFIYSTPWNRYNLSLTLDKIVDTGAYSKGYWQSLAKTGTFTARSSAGTRQAKYFYIKNIKAYEDLANYVNKLLYVYQNSADKLDSFRPFIPHLKGEDRSEFMKKYPQFWS